MQPTSRDEILATLRQFGGGMTMKEAGEAYGVPVGTIKCWAARRAAGKERPEQPKVVRPMLEVVKGEKAPPPPEPTPRAREAMKGREAHYTAVGTALGEEVRENLRTTVRMTAAALAALAEKAANGEDVALQMVNLARTQDALLGRAAELLTFDKSTAAVETKQGVDLLDADAVAQTFRARARVEKRA